MLCLGWSARLSPLDRARTYLPRPCSDMMVLARASLLGCTQTCSSKHTRSCLDWFDHQSPLGRARTCLPQPCSDLLALARPSLLGFVRTLSSHPAWMRLDLLIQAYSVVFGLARTCSSQPCSSGKMARLPWSYSGMLNPPLGSRIPPSKIQCKTIIFYYYAI